MRLGETLISRGQLSEEDLERALELQKERGDKLGRILVDLGFVAHRDVVAALADQLGVAMAKLDGPPLVSPETERLSVRFLRQARMVPLRMDGGALVVAMADPLDFESLAATRAACGLKVHAEIALEPELADVLDRYYVEEGEAGSRAGARRRERS